MTSNMLPDSSRASSTGFYKMEAGADHCGHRGPCCQGNVSVRGCKPGAWRSMHGRQTVRVPAECTN